MTTRSRSLIFLLVAVVVITGAAFALLYVFYPGFVLRSLEQQCDVLAARCLSLEKSGDKVAAWKLAQVTLLLAPVENRQALLRLLGRLSYLERDDSHFIDHCRAETLAAEELCSLGEPVVTQLGIVLKEPGVRQGRACVALRVLGKISRERARPVIKSILKRGDNDILTREAVIESLRLELTETAPLLDRLVKSWRNWGRQYPVFVLRRFGYRKAAENIIQALDDDSPAVVRHCAMALADLAGGEALPALRRAAARNAGDKITSSIVNSAIARIRRRLPAFEKCSDPSGR